jgi:hypothetical protein
MRRALVGLTLVGMVLAIRTGRAEVTITPLGGDSLAAGPVPTMKEVQGEFEDARFTVCIQKIGRVLSSEPAPSAEDKCALLSLKGECLIHQKQAAMAAEAFSDAAQAATDKTDIATATATSALLRHSENFTYTPVTGKDHKPLPIGDKAKRAPAMAALFTDELTRAKPLIASTVASADIQPVLDFATPFHALALLEIASTGGTVQLDGVQKTLADHAHELIAAQIAKMNADADAIVADAAKMVEIPGTNGGPARHQRKGLTDDNRQQITDMAAACDKLEETAKEVVTAYALAADFFQDEVANIETLKKRLKGISNGNFRTAKAMPVRGSIGG